MNIPLVTICCTAYNHEPYIRECLEGFVMQQTNFKFEAVVHDDASTDGTAAIIAEFAERYPEIIKPLYETENQYSKKDGSLERIMASHMQGKYIATCEGDDYWTDPLKLQKQVDILERECGVFAVVTNSSICDKDSNIIEEYRQVTKSNRTGQYNLHDFFREEHQYPTLTVMYRNEHKAEILNNQLLCRNQFLGDWVLWILLYQYGDFYFLNEVTASYRLNPSSVTHTCNDIKRWEADFKIRENIISILPLEYHKYLKNSWNTYFKLAMAYRKQKKNKLMIKFFMQSFFAHPLKFSKRIIDICRYKSL